MIRYNIIIENNPGIPNTVVVKIVVIFIGIITFTADIIRFNPYNIQIETTIFLII